MKTIGLCARSLSPGTRAMFNALGEALGVSFVERAFGDDRSIDGWILLEADRQFVSDSCLATRPCYVVLDEAELIPCGTSSKISFSKHSELPAVLRDQEVTADDASDAKCLPPWLTGAVPVAFKERAPVWAIHVMGPLRHHYVALLPPALSEDDSLFHHFSGQRMARLLPLLLFVRSLADEPGWESSPLQASFMLDDANLHWKSYGFIEYRKLVAHARVHGYHVSVATIPLDAWLVHPATRAIFKENTDWISLLFHGNDHLSQELVRARSAEATRHLLNRAIARIARMEARTGLDVSRVMAPPHEACSEAALAEMARLGFEAACVSPALLRYHDGGAAWARTMALRRCDIVAGLPVIPRFGLSTQCRNDILIAALLGRPIVPMTHHQAVADGYDVLDETASFVSSLGKVAWGDMKTISRSLYLQRQDNGTRYVRMLSKRVTVPAREGATQIRVERPWLEDASEEPLFWRIAAADGYWHLMARPEGIPVQNGATIEIASGSTGTTCAGTYGAESLRLTPIVRRFLTEARDRALPSIHRLARRASRVVPQSDQKKIVRAISRDGGEMSSLPVRVLLLVENNPYPMDFRLRREAHSLRDAGCRVTVIAPRGAAERWSEDTEGIRVYRFPAPPSGNGLLSYMLEFGYATLAILLLTVWVSLRRGVDVIHAANPPDTLFVVGAIFKMLGKRFVFDQHDLAPETYLSRFRQPRQNVVYRTLALLERCSYAVADVVIATNESYKQLAVTRGRKRADRVFVVRNGPPLSYQMVQPDAHVGQRAKYLIGYVGTIGPQDGVDHWIRAVHQLVFRFERRDFLAIVIGDGDAFAAVRTLARTLEVEPYVWFTGRLPESEVRKYLSAVHVCVQPDPLSPLNDKSTMNKLMEYMALGKPTVAFDLTETRYSAQESALYVRPNDEVEFARQVSWLLDNPAERERMGIIGQERVRHGLAWEHSAGNLLAAYGKALRVVEIARSGS